MCSGNGTNFENIVRSCPDIKVALMVHNVENCGARDRAFDLGVPHCCIKSKDEELIIRTFKALDLDLIVLAGWMRILSSKFIKAFPNKIINIHPSLLPKYKGLNSIQRAMDNRDYSTGCTVHMVTEELDSGKIIEQEIVPILPTDTVETLTSRIQKAEHYLLPLAIRHVGDT